MKGNRRKTGATALLCLVFLGAVATSALAIMSDSAQVPDNTFTSGSVAISTDHPTTAVVSYAGMMPGDSVGANPLLVTNDGTATLRYAVTAEATNDDQLGLKDALQLTIKTIDATTPGTPCNDFDGTTLYSGDLDSSAGALIGDVSQGNQAGDRTLSAGSSETLCFRTSFPSAATGPASASTTATFTFTSEQTASNA